MLRYPRRFWVLAVSLAALAGFVDAIGFIRLGGLFVSFMSGNSTRLGVDLAAGLPAALIAAQLIAAFVAGSALGTVVAHFAGGHRKMWVLNFVAAVLTGAASLAMFGQDGPAIIAMAISMGAANAVFQRDGEVAIGVTYMSGALVKFGQRLAAVFMGGDRWGWLPYGMLWCGLLVGAILGAHVYAFLAMKALWLAAGFAAILAIVAERMAAA